jgi:hypothetical protein
MGSFTVIRGLFFVAGAVAGAAGSADAALLNLSLLPVPDITSGFIDVSYNASSDAFSAQGFAFSMTDSPNRTITNGTFNLSAIVDSAGMATSGTITIGGTIPAIPAGTPLLTGTLTAFGFQTGGGSIFEFLFSVTGGSLATPAYFGNSGVGVFGVILNASGATFNGNWGQSFNNNGGIPGFGNGVADTAPIPAPVVAAPFAIAGFFAGRRRRA